MKKKNYINNADFSKAVEEYAVECRAAKAKGQDNPEVPEYVWRCVMHIANKLALRPNFYGYSYRDEMVDDAIENCLTALPNYNIEAATRTGKPNAFGYYTQICWYAFLRRIAKEKRQAEIKIAMIDNMSSGDIVTHSPYQDHLTTSITTSHLESIREKLRENEENTDDEYVPEEKQVIKRRRATGDSDLNDFLVDED